MKIIAVLLCAAFSVAVAGSADAARRKGKTSRSKKARTEVTENKKKSTAYEKLFKDKKVTSVSGLFTLHKIDGKVYMEVPVALFGRRMAVGTTVDMVSDPHESSVGIQPVPPVQVVFDMADSVVRISRLTDRFVAGDADQGIKNAIARAHSGAIIASYPVKAVSPDSSAVVFDATKFFIGSQDELKPFDPDAYNAMGGFVVRKSSFKSDNSMVVGVAAFDDNVSVTSCLSYTVSMYLLGAFPISKDKPFTAYVKRTFLLLPEVPARQRLADARVGTKRVRYVEYSGGQTGAKPVYYASRWRLEPADSAAFAAGRLSEPVKPIVFYLDPALPASWVERIRSAAGKWNKCFEATGYRNAIRTEMYPENDSLFDATNIKYSCIRYITTPSDNIRDNVWYDPLTGEILSANIYVSSNLPAMIRRYHFIQLAASDPDSRKIQLSEEQVGESLEAMIMRNIGHCIGLSDNMAGSNAYPTDSLRKASFTGRYGLSASVMDEMRYNYLASEKDYADGVKLIQTDPGEYDFFAVKWLYGPVAGAVDPKDELSTLRDMVAEKAGQKAFRYGPAQNSKVFYDPRSMSQDLGDDAIRSAEYAFRNMATMIKGANQWIDREDYDYSYRSEFYNYVIDQLYEYVKHVMVNIGGIYVNERYAGDPDPAYVPVPRSIQKRSLNWIIRQLEDMSWVDNDSLLANSGLEGSVADFCQRYFSQFIYSQIGEMWFSESKSDDPYTQAEAMGDVISYVMRHARAGTRPSESNLNMQTQLVENLISMSKVAASAGRGASSSGSSLAITDSDRRMIGMMVRGRYRVAGMHAVSPVVVNEFATRYGMEPQTRVAYQVAPSMEHVWYGMLLDVRKIISAAAKNAPTKELRDHYAYLDYRIGKSLKID